ncbi:hypothetical protein [Borreliella japonica]|uniref:hypothetical protein n=1 Tax=Borreliella japonica TaxID=34095 RepID=UPI003AEFF67C
MKKKMVIICAVFALILSCKNYASGEDLKEQTKEIKQGVEQKVKGFLEAKKEELTEGLKNFGSEVFSKVKEELMQADEPQGQLQHQVAQDVNNKNQEVEEELKKKIEELKKKINASGDKTTLETYSGYEKELEGLKEKLKDKKEQDKKELEKELETLEKALKEKIEKRKKALEAAQKEFEKLKEQVDGATGQTAGARVQKQGNIGQQAWQCANKLGLNGSYSNSDSTDSNDFAKKVIDNAIKKIEEELKNTIENTKE